MCSLFQQCAPSAPAPPLSLSLPSSPASQISSTTSTIHSSGAPKGNRSLQSKVLPPLGLPCFPTHPSPPSLLKLCIEPVCSHNSILGYRRPPADLLASSCCKNTAAAIRLSDYSWLITGGAASLKREGKVEELLLPACPPSQRAREKTAHVFTPPAVFPRSGVFQRRVLCKPLYF